MPLLLSLLTCLLMMAGTTAHAEPRSYLRANARRASTSRPTNRTRRPRTSTSRSRSSRNRAVSVRQVAVVTSPTNWLNHYLPVDRQRIKGRLWKYVSTDLDTYYHRPESPLMLAQAPDNVIGFASAHDAEEAVYLPEPAIAAARSGGGSLGALTSGRLTYGGAVTVRSRGTTHVGGTFSIPASRIPRDVLVIIRTTDVLADTIDATSDLDDLRSLKIILFQMRSGEIAGKNLGAITGNRQAFQNPQRWIPILQFLEQAVDAKMNQVSPEVGAAVAQQSTNMARANARMLIPNIQAWMNQNFGAAVQSAQGGMLTPNPSRRGRGPM